MKRISIVTVSFNQAEFLEQALLSVLDQDYPDLDYIVVDPGSTDGSRDIIEQYRSRISKTVLRPDKGPADGLNHGFAEATGEIFGFINADDYLLPGALRAIGTFAESNPQYDLILGNGYIVDGKGQNQKHVKARDFTLRKYFYGGATWLQQSTFMSAQIFRRSSGFSIESHTSWDGELFVRLLKLGAAVGYINADLAAFRIHAASISGSGRMNEAYRREWKCSFRNAMGRDWRSSDEFVKFFYRFNKFVVRKLTA